MCMLPQLYKKLHLIARHNIIRNKSWCWWADVVYSQKQLARLESNALEARRKREADLAAVRKKIDKMRIAAHGERMDKRVCTVK